jgi:energy-coupling factor transporter transmembrane protein EcfT
VSGDPVGGEPAPGRWQRWHPAEKVVASAAVLIAAFASTSPSANLALAATVGGLLVASARVRVGRLLAVWGALALSGALGAATIPLSWGGSRPSLDAAQFSVAWLVFSRTLACAGASLLVGTTTDATDLLHAGHGRLPDALLIVLAGIHRFGRTLAQRARVMREAQARRFGYISLAATRRSLAMLAIGLFVDAAAMAVRVDAGLAARGLGPHLPSPRRYEPFKTVRAVLLTISTLAPWLAVVSW